jgi:hypothetical protein
MSFMLLRLLPVAALAILKTFDEEKMIIHFTLSTRILGTLLAGPHVGTEVQEHWANANWGDIKETHFVYSRCVCCLGVDVT